MASILVGIFAVLVAAPVVVGTLWIAEEEGDRRWLIGWLGLLIALFLGVVVLGIIVLIGQG